MGSQKVRVLIFMKTLSAIGMDRLGMFFLLSFLFLVFATMLRGVSHPVTLDSL